MKEGGGDRSLNSIKSADSLLSGLLRGCKQKSEKSISEVCLSQEWPWLQFTHNVTQSESGVAQLITRHSSHPHGCEVDEVARPERLLRSVKMLETTEGSEHWTLRIVFPSNIESDWSLILSISSSVIAKKVRATGVCVMRVVRILSCTHTAHSTHFPKIFSWFKSKSQNSNCALDKGERDVGNESMTWPHRVDREMEGKKDGAGVGLWEKVGARLGKDVAEAREGIIEGR
jgi:hypothetical protein